MKMVVLPDGTTCCVYGEAINLAALGEPTIIRASHVEPDLRGRWSADLSPVGGPRLGPFTHRSDALSAEAAWLDKHWLGRGCQEGSKLNCRGGMSESDPDSDRDLFTDGSGGLV